MRIAIYGRQFNDDSLPYVLEVLQELKGYDSLITIHEPFREFIRSRGLDVSGTGGFRAGSDLEGKADFLLSLGGDGTLLDTVTLIGDSGLPVLGINLGRLGFLASINKVDIKKALESLMEGRYTLDKRSLLHLDAGKGNGELFNGFHYALNEMSVFRSEDASMIIIRVYLNGELLNSYWADGLIVATPTGSTAYSLSCGGPIIIPESNNFVITPICPHNLSVRPVIIGEDSLLSFEVEGRAEEFQVSLDSRKEHVPTSTRLAVSKERFSINLVRLDNETYLGTLRNKLKWGLDSRN